MSNARTYIAIDLKSFYASVECAARGLDPLTTNLVVADMSRTEKTICLAVSPSLKSYGIPGRARLFEVIQRVRDVNAQRRWKYRAELIEGVYDNNQVKGNPAIALDYIVAPPRMAEYMKVSSQVYATYLQFISADDIHVYSIDEVFMDVTDYLRSYDCSAHELAMRMIREVLKNTGITATAGIGSNMYLAKIAMDIEAKHSPADKDGVRIAELDEMSYRRKYWEHTPLTDFWRIGHGIAKKLEANGMRTMGDVARMSLNGEEALYKLFGVNAELLIDHAWGWEPCTIKDIKAYKPSSHSLSVGQVLSEPYTFNKARVVIQEMADSLSLDLVDKRLVCDQMVLYVGYDSSSLLGYSGDLESDYYGRSVPKPANASVNLSGFTSSSAEIIDAVASLFDRIVNKDLLVRRMSVAANHTLPEGSPETMQLSLFEAEEKKEDSARERRRQEAILTIKKKYGKNAILKGLNFEEGATQRERNKQVGGHKA
ncbi:MAG: Y-family DNA polymerase [Bacteroidales bacterium]|nr:Y-family DNA polymerase [Bacteroidales bacterium]